jgi:hypothetical protein
LTFKQVFQLLQRDFADNNGALARRVAA